jgi:hypothetical protein
LLGQADPVQATSFDDAHGGLKARDPHLRRFDNPSHPGRSFKYTFSKASSNNLPVSTSVELRNAGGEFVGI